MDNYADGVASIHLANSETDIKAWSLPDCSKNKYSGDSSSAASNKPVSFLKLINVENDWNINLLCCPN